MPAERGGAAGKSRNVASHNPLAYQQGGADPGEGARPARLQPAQHEEGHREVEGEVAGVADAEEVGHVPGAGGGALDADAEGQLQAMSWAWSTATDRPLPTRPLLPSCTYRRR
jgi:hypothetical protein